MRVTEIQSRVDALSKAMLAKGLSQPSAQFHIESGREPCVMLKWYKATKDWSGSTKYEWLRADTAAKVLDAADAFVAGLPSADETKFREFMSALGGVIDLGKTNGIEVEFLNPLVATMKKLSENALTDQRASS